MMVTSLSDLTDIVSLAEAEAVCMPSTAIRTSAAAVMFRVMVSDSGASDAVVEGLPVKGGEEAACRVGGAVPS